MYIDAELITDETAVAEAILAGLADRLDAALDLAEGEGWEAQEGSPETSLGEAVGIVIATAAAMVQDRERNDYAEFGQIILGVPRQSAEPAVGYTTWTFSEPRDYLIPDGSELTMRATDGTPIGYATVGDVQFSGTVAADVQVVALEPGSIANGLVGVADDWEALPDIISVEMTTPPTGGTDEQTLEEYLEDVVRRARRMTDVPIVTDDYAEKALDHPSVAAAMAVRLLNDEVYPGPPASAGHVHLFTRDAAGQPNVTAVQDELLAMMQGEDRPLAVTVHAGDPTYTPFAIDVTVRLSAGADEPATVTLVEAALVAAYDPAVYGIDSDAPGRWRPPVTTADRTISQYDVAAVIDDLEGVEGVVDVEIEGVASIELDGWAPLPDLTAVTVTVV
jgi:hypothetical protein